MPELDRLVAGFAGNADLVQDGRRADRARVQAVDEVGHRRSPRGKMSLHYPTPGGRPRERPRPFGPSLIPSGSAVPVVILLEFPRTIAARSAAFSGRFTNAGLRIAELGGGSLRR